MDNNQTLTIIVPYHGEPIGMVEECLSSINRQKFIDFSRLRVSICCNIPPFVSKEFSETVYKQDNICNNIYFFQDPFALGPGNNRQQALDALDTDWVMFLDMDDVLYSVDTLAKVFSSIDTYLGKAQIIAERAFEVTLSTMTAELSDIHRTHIVWDKVFNAKFLKDNGIKFHPDLHIYEDVYFYQCCVLNKPAVAFVGDTITLHTERDLPDNMSTFNRCLHDYDSFLDMRDNAHKQVNYLCQYADEHHLEINKIDVIINELFIDFMYIIKFMSVHEISINGGVLQTSPEEFTKLIASFYGPIMAKYKKQVAEYIDRRDYNVDGEKELFSDYVSQLFYGGTPLDKLK